MDKKYVIALSGIMLFAAFAITAFAAAGGKPSGSAGGLFGTGLFDQSCVGVVDVSGEIATQDNSGGIFSQGSAGSGTIAQEIKDADADGNVKAILVTIDSPGGSVVATQEIYDALEKSKKPKVAYFGETAASGGYYVGVATDYIVSEPAALTGSIGVRATVEDLSPLFEKIGYNTTTFKSGEFKDMGDPSRPMTDGEKAIFQGIVDEIFQDFKAAVMKHRGDKINNAEIGQIFDARVMTGRQALGYGLVDALGNKDDALSKAAELGGMQDTAEPNICDFSQKQTNILSELFSSMSYGISKGIGSMLGTAQGRSISIS